MKGGGSLVSLTLGGGGAGLPRRIHLVCFNAVLAFVQLLGKINGWK